MGRGRKIIYESTPLAQWLKRRDRTRSEFARAVRCSAWRITEICKGLPPGSELARRIVAETGGDVSFADLFGGEPTQESAA